MSYHTLEQTWAHQSKYELNSHIKEHYTPRVTMSLPEWQNYVASGQNTLLGSGGVIPSGTVQTAGGNSGAVYRGIVHQGWS